MPGPTPTWDADLKAAQHQAIDAAVADGRITAEQAAEAHHDLDHPPGSEDRPWPPVSRS